MPDNGLPPRLVPEWVDFLLADMGRATRSESYDALFGHHLLFPLQRRRELEAMVDMAAKIKPKTLLVIGGDKGGDSWSFIKACPTLKNVIIIEIRGVPYVSTFASAFPHLRVFGIEDSSYAPGTVDKVRTILTSLGCVIDVAFLDGDKCNYHRDYKAYRPMMSRGGIMFMHDCHPGTNPADFPCGVFFRSLPNTSLILDTSEHDEALQTKPGDEKHFENSHTEWLRYWAKIPTCGVGVIPVE